MSQRIPKPLTSTSHTLSSDSALSSLHSLVHSLSSLHREYELVEKRIGECQQLSTNSVDLNHQLQHQVEKDILTRQWAKLNDERKIERTKFLEAALHWSQHQVAKCPKDDKNPKAANECKENEHLREEEDDSHSWSEDSILPTAWWEKEETQRPATSSSSSSSSFSSSSSSSAPTTKLDLFKQLKQNGGLEYSPASIVLADDVPSIPVAPPLTITKGKAVSWVISADSSSSSSSSSSSASRGKKNRKSSQRNAECEVQQTPALITVSTKGELLAIPRAPLTKYETGFFVASSNELEAFECAICYHVAFNPPALGCNHLFCKHCIDTFLHQSCQKNGASCPTCTRRFSHTREYQRCEQLDKLQVKCQQDGCNWIGSLGHCHSGYDQHVEECGYVGIICNDCSATVLRRDMSNHQTHHCSQRRIECPFCDIPMKVADFGHHLEQATPDGPCEFTRFCPFGCINDDTATILPLDEYDNHTNTCSNRLIDCIICVRPHSLSPSQLLSHYFDMMPCSEEIGATLIQRSDELTQLRRTMTIQQGRNTKSIDNGTTSAHPSLNGIPITPPLSSHSLAPSSSPNSSTQSEDEDGWKLVTSVSSSSSSSSAPSPIPIAPPLIPSRPATVELIGHLPGLFDNRPVTLPRSSPIVEILQLQPFKSINSHRPRFYLISQEGDWDQINNECTPDDLGMENGTRIGIKVV